MQVVGHRHVVDLQAEGKGVDKHTHRIRNLQVRAPAADGREIDLTVVGITRDDVTRGSEEKMGRRDILLTAEGSSTIHFGRTDGLADKALLVALGQVGRNLTAALTSLQFLCKELLG